MVKVAVEPQMNDVKELLQQNGYEVTGLDAAALNNCQCCVISGQDQNMMGMADTATQASVINAHGMTAQEILDRVNQVTRS